MIESALIAAGAYLAAGVGASAWLLTRGIPSRDADLAATPWPTRLVLVPGCAALWPLLMLRFTRTTREKRS